MSPICRGHGRGLFVLGSRLGEILKAKQDRKSFTYKKKIEMSIAM